MDEKAIAVSVTYALPVYNKARFLPGVLAAVAAERAATGGEILCLDDASTDDSPAILAQSERCGIRILRFPVNRGVMAATAALIEAAGKPWLRLVDADDTLIPGSTARLLSALDASDAVLAFGRAEAAGLGDRAAGRAAMGGPRRAGEPLRLRRPVRATLERQWFNPSMTLIPTAAARATLPWPVDIRTAQDFWLALQLAARGDFLACPFPAAVIAADEAGLSRQKARVFADTCRLIALARPRLGQAEARFALRRQAARTLRFFRREAPGALGLSERLRLAAFAAGLGLREARAENFLALAALYEATLQPGQGFAA